MVGSGANRKSIAYVENVAAFLEQCLLGDPGFYLFNYVDKPDLDMNSLVAIVRRAFGKSGKVRLRAPVAFAFGIGLLCDLVAKVTGQKFVISAIRVKKFVTDSVFETAINPSVFMPPVPLDEAIARTIRFEFIDDNSGVKNFYSE